MSINIIKYLVLIPLNSIALLLSLTPYNSEPFLIFATLTGMLPLLSEVLLSLKSNKYNLGLPVLVTFLVLLYLKEYRLDAFFVLLILIGGSYKEYINWRVRKSITDISIALPHTAFLKLQELTEVDISKIRAGDIVVVKKGDRVPVDGTLISDNAILDEAVVSGESKPVSKKNGDPVTAGSISQSNYIEIKSTGTAQTSTLAQVQKMVNEAQARSAPLASFTIRYAEITSIVAFLFVVIVFLLGNNLYQALALWVALVPVIFAIIVPVATTIGITILTKQGVLIKSAEASESLTKINTFVFDKTGTLTTGEPEITDFRTFLHFKQEELLQLAASLENYSDHPLARPIISESRKRNLDMLQLTNITVTEGKGISGFNNEEEIVIGNSAMLLERGISIDRQITNVINDKELKGSSVVYIAIGDKLAGLFFIEDEIREEAAAVIRRLKQRGYDIIMLSGDKTEVAAKIASQLGITEVHSEMLPGSKQILIRDLKAKGMRLAMVGDGINDAPALAEADVGIAIGTYGADLTLNSADIVLLNGNLTKLLQAIDGSKQVFGIIKQDLIIATVIHFATALLVLFNISGITGSISA